MEEKKDYKLYLDTATLAGKLMLQNGAEIYRVEDTIQRMLAVSGLKTAEAYVTATGIMVTLDDPKEDSMTVIKRIPSRGTDLNTVSIVNDISRKFCSGQMTLKEAFHDLKHLDSRQYTEFQKALCVFGVALFLPWCSAAPGGRLWRRESTVCSSFWPFVFPNGSRLTPLWRRCSPPCFWRREQWS